MYRPDWWPEDMPGVLSICQILHMNHTGACQDIKPEDRALMIQALQWLTNNWVDSREETVKYDNAVFDLIGVTLGESETPF